MPDFFEAVGVSFDENAGIVSCHGDKCYGYQHQWEENNIPFEHGVAIYLLTYVRPYGHEVRDTTDGWIDPGNWVVKNYSRFKEHLLKAEELINMTSDKIKLAEAMGLIVAPISLEDCGGPFLVTAQKIVTSSDALEAEWVEWNPFTDANDDYAVLEWAKTQSAQFQHDFQCALAELTTNTWFRAHSWNYQIGYYARAALKVKQ